MREPESNIYNISKFTAHDLFLSELFFIDLEEALPGSLLPEITKPLTFNSEHITPLIPLNDILLNYLTPEDLISRLKFQAINANRVRVTLNLSPQNKQDNKSSENYSLFKDYQVKEENAIAQLPVLEVWPNFCAEGWQEYYAFYYDAEHGEETFQVQLHEAKEFKKFTDKRGSFQIARMEEFPSGVKCYSGKEKKLVGLILLPTPEKIELRGSWKVGVDFNYKFTNVYINKNNYAEPLALENLLLNVTYVEPDTRLRVLFEYFIPENFIPESKPLPLSTVLTTRGSKTQTDEIRPIFDGRIYIPDNFSFKPQEDWIKTNLRWEPKNHYFSQLFLKHLALHICALAAKNGIAQIQWSLSYPSTFSKRDAIYYLRNWDKLTKELQNKTGIRQISPDFSADDKYFRNNFRIESLAAAQYFKDHEGRTLLKTTCIHIRDDNSDISIWEENKLVHQCSLQLGSQGLFSDYLSLNPQFFIKRFGVNAYEWEKLNRKAFNAKLDVWLRLEGDKWLKSKKYQVEQEEDFLGFTLLTAIGIAGLYYYVGILLKVLHDEKKYSRNEITEVYIGGNGSSVLNWLAEAGQFNSNSEVNELLSRMLSKGSGFQDTQIKTKLSQNPGDEVACGLVLNHTPIEGKSIKEKDPLIVGESCKINGHQIYAQSRLDLEPLDLEEKDINEFKIPEPVNIAQFFYDFHQALQDLQIEDIKSLPSYQNSPELNKNKQLWRKVKDEISNLLLEQKGKKSDTIRLEPPFITCLKALLNVLSKQWVG